MIISLEYSVSSIKFRMELGADSDLAAYVEFSLSNTHC